LNHRLREPHSSSAPTADAEGTVAFLVQLLRNQVEGRPDLMGGSFAGPRVRAETALAFEPQKKPRSASGLSELQRSVLTTLVQSDRAWDFGNVFFVLHQFGLPSLDRNEMAEFLGLPSEGLE
jgi:hypothetical protein